LAGHRPDPRSGLGVRAEFAEFDAERRFPVAGIQTAEPTICRAGDVLRGVLKPFDCPAFGTVFMGGSLGNWSAVRDAFAQPRWFISMFLASLAYGIGEEPGWRGYALPALQRNRTAFRATALSRLGIVARPILLLPVSFQRGG
jgi:hypothetical protein